MQESTPMVRVADAKALDAEPDQWVQALQSEPGRTRVTDMILKLGGGDAARVLAILCEQVGTRRFRDCSAQTSDSSARLQRQTRSI